MASKRKTLKRLRNYQQNGGGGGNVGQNQSSGPSQKPLVSRNGAPSSTTVFSSATSPVKQRSAVPQEGNNEPMPPKHPLVSSSPIPHIGAINKFYQKVNQVPPILGTDSDRKDALEHSSFYPSPIDNSSHSIPSRSSSRSSSKHRPASPSKRDSSTRGAPRNTRRLSQMLHSSVLLDHTDFESLLQIFKQDTSFYLTLQQSFHKLKLNFHDSKKEVGQMMEELLKLKYELSLQKRNVENMLMMTRSTSNAVSTRPAPVGSAPRSVQDEHFLELRQGITNINSKVNQSDSNSRKTYRKLLTKIKSLEQHVTKNDTIFRGSIQQLELKHEMMQETGDVEEDQTDEETPHIPTRNEWRQRVEKLEKVVSQMNQPQPPHQSTSDTDTLLRRLHTLERNVERLYLQKGSSNADPSDTTNHTSDAISLNGSDLESHQSENQKKINELYQMVNALPSSSEKTPSTELEMLQSDLRVMSESFEQHKKDVEIELRRHQDTTTRHVPPLQLDDEQCERLIPTLQEELNTLKAKVNKLEKSQAVEPHNADETTHSYLPPNSSSTPQTEATVTAFVSGQSFQIYKRENQEQMDAFKADNLSKLDELRQMVETLQGAQANAGPVAEGSNDQLTTQLQVREDVIPTLQEDLKALKATVEELKERQDREVHHESSTYGVESHPPDSIQVVEHSQKDEQPERDNNQISSKFDQHLDSADSLHVALRTNEDQIDNLSKKLEEQKKSSAAEVQELKEQLLSLQVQMESLAQSLKKVEQASPSVGETTNPTSTPHDASDVQKTNTGFSEASQKEMPQVQNDVTSLEEENFKLKQKLEQHDRVQKENQELQRALQKAKVDNQELRSDLDALLQPHENGEFDDDEVFEHRDEHQNDDDAFHADHTGKEMSTLFKFSEVGSDIRIDNLHCTATRSRSVSNATWQTAFTNKSLRSGTHSARFIIDDGGDICEIMIGVADPSFVSIDNQDVGSSSRGWALNLTEGDVMTNGFGRSFLTENVSTGDIIDVKLDLDRGELFFGVEGTKDMSLACRSITAPVCFAVSLSNEHSHRVSLLDTAEEDEWTTDKVWGGFKRWKEK